MANKYRIADLVVSMDSFGRTQKQAIPYLCESKDLADIVIQSDHRNIKNKFPDISDDVAEYVSTGASFYTQLLNYNGFMLHASAVVVDGKAYLFSANPGTGKSTHTRLWLEYFGERAYILNDDKPALRLINGKWYAFGTPWSGKENISVNTGIELAGIAVIKRSEENKIDPYTGKFAIFDIIGQVNRPKSYELRVRLMDLINELLESIPIWSLKCNMNIEAAKIAYNSMNAEQESK